MDTKALAKRLNSSVVFVEDSFTKYNLRVVGFGFCNIAENGQMEFLVEIESLSSKKIPTDIEVVVNLYNEDGALIGNDDSYIEKDDYDGNDTLRFYFRNDGIAFEAYRSRVYAKKDD